MSVQNATKIKEEIITFLKNNGPSLPVPISRYIKIDSLFASAFLSELLSEQQIKITNMKVGGSPVYYSPGTETGLEKYSEYLKSKEKEAYLLLKENQFLEDETQEPAIRIALRQIKDFAKPFNYNEKLIWRYYLTPQENYKNENKKEMISQVQKEEENKQPETKLPKTFVSSIQQTFKENETSSPIEKEEKIISQKIEIEKIQEIKKEIIPPQKESFSEEKPLFSNPLAKQEEPKKSKEKPKSAFVESVIRFIQNQGWTIIEETESKAKEYSALVEVNSDLGPIIFKTQAKDKKTINEADLLKILGEAQSIPLPALIMSPGEIQKKAIPLLEKYKSVLKFKKIQ